MWHNKTVPFTWSAHQDNWLRYSAFCKVLSQAVKIERNVTSAWVRTRQTKETWLVVKTSSYIITSHHNGWIAARCGMVVQNKKVTYRFWVLKRPHQRNCIVCWLFCQLHVRTEVCPQLCGINVKCKYTREANSGKLAAKNVCGNQTNGLCGLPTILKGNPTDAVQLPYGLMREEHVSCIWWWMGTLVLIHDWHSWEVEEITQKTCIHMILS